MTNSCYELRCNALQMGIPLKNHVPESNCGNCVKYRAEIVFSLIIPFRLITLLPLIYPNLLVAPNSHEVLSVMAELEKLQIQKFYSEDHSRLVKKCKLGEVY